MSIQIMIILEALSAIKMKVSHLINHKATFSIIRELKTRRTHQEVRLKLMLALVVIVMKMRQIRRLNLKRHLKIKNMTQPCVIMMIIKAC